MNTDILQKRLRGAVITALEPRMATESDALIWNGRKPAARARLIVRAACTEDVAEAVRFAGDHGLTVSPRGGGHQFAGIAAGADMVIDLGALDGLRLDVEARTARVEPAVTNARLAAALERHGLAFPLGHCGSVPMSGYLLGGGVGWNSAEWGFACFSVTAVEVVLADGRMIVADATQNADIFWAARGAGPAFFGVVTAYHLSLQEAAKAISTAIRVYPGRRRGRGRRLGRDRHGGGARLRGVHLQGHADAAGPGDRRHHHGLRTQRRGGLRCPLHALPGRAR